MITLHIVAVIAGFYIPTKSTSYSPHPNLDMSQQPLAGNDDIDITTGSQFNGLTTFANLPYANCFVDGEVEEYDIAILGAPFDTVGTFPSGRNYTWQKRAAQSTAKGGMLG